MKQKLRIGTRGSKLALIQTGKVAQKLCQAHPDLDVEIVTITTGGDWRPEQGETRLCEAKGGKGQFAHEIEQAILENHVDCGIHSMKDMPAILPEGLEIAHMLEREDPHDALLANGDVRALADLPQGAVIGTSSLRRQAFLLARRPDLKIVPLRGNVPTRIEKLRSGQVDATILACAGLNRLDLGHEISFTFTAQEMLPAAGQGAVGIEIRSADQHIRALCDAIAHSETGFCVGAEREALRILDGSCHTPIGAYARRNAAGHMILDVLVASPDGVQIFHERHESAVRSLSDALALGAKAGHALRDKTPPALFT